MVFSSDVKALYPSLKVDEVSRIIAEEYEKSSLEIEVNEEELGLYLALAGDRERIRELGLINVISSWKKEGGRGQRPGITTAEVLGGEKSQRKVIIRKT